MKQMSAHEETIRTMVCSECIYPSGSGICGTGEWQDCPLNKFLPRALEAVEQGKAGTIVEYFERLMKRIPEKKTGNVTATLEDARWVEQHLPLIAVAEEEAERKKSLHRSAGRKHGTN